MSTNCLVHPSHARPVQLLASNDASVNPVHGSDASEANATMVSFVPLVSVGTD